MFGLSNPLTDPLVQVLELLNDAAAGMPLPLWLSSYAIAIILIAIIIKLLTYPLTVSQMRSMKAMQELQPKLKSLQKKYKDDREKQAQAQMELYREEGVNPFGSCLPLIVQMVVLFGLYSAIRQLSSNGALEGERFLWIGNLAACEANPLCDDAAATGLFVPGTEIGIPVLLIVLVLSQFAYQRFATPPSSDAQAQTMNQTMKFMPLFLAFIFARLAAGLVLYYTVFNAVTVAQQALLMRGTSQLSLPVIGGRGQESEDGASEGGRDASESEGQAERNGGDVASESEEQNKHERAPRRRRRRKKKH